MPQLLKNTKTNRKTHTCTVTIEVETVTLYKGGGARESIQLEDRVVWKQGSRPGFTQNPQTSFRMNRKKIDLETALSQ